MEMMQTSESFRRIGPQDLAGIPGLGPLPIDPDEPVWHAPWEGRVIGATLAAVTTGTLVPPTHRAQLERLHPLAYLGMSYYELWLYGLEQCAIAAGALTLDEIEDRLAEWMAGADAPMPRERNSKIADQVRHLVSEGAPAGPQRLEQPPRFVVGDTVRTKLIEIGSPGHSHTRIPGYAQQRSGTVEILHPPMLLGDALVAGEGIRFEYVYAVRLRTRDVWADARARDSILVDLWESYLVDDPTTTEGHSDE
jgi:nitrile hydratase